MADRISKLLFQYEVDTGSQSRVLQSIEAVEQSLVDVRDELGDLNPVSRASLTSLTNDFRLAESSSRDLEMTIEDLRAELSRVDDTSGARELAEDLERVDRNATEAAQSLDRAQDAAERLGRTDATPDTGSSRRDQFDAIENLGERSAAIFGGFEGGNEIANLAGLIGDVGAAAGTLNPLLTAGALAIGGVTLALGEFARQAEEAREDALRYIEAQGELINLIAGGATTTDIEKQIEGERRRQEGIQRTGDELAAYRTELDALNEAYFEAVDRATAQPSQENDRALATAESRLNLFFRRVSEATQGDIFDERRLNEAIAGNRSALDEVADNIARLTGRLGDPQLLENDAAAFEAEMQERIPEAFRSLAGEFAAGVEGFFDFLDGEERTGLSAALGDGSDASKTAAQEFDALSLALGDMTGAAENAKAAAAEAAEAERELAEERQKLAGDEYLEALELRVEADKKAVEAARELAEAEQEHADRLTRIDTEMRTAIAKAAGEREESIAEARSKAADRLLKIEEKLGEDLARIKAKYGDQIEDAEGRRDVEGAIRLKKQRDQELKDREKSAEDQRKEVDDSLKEQLRIIDQRYREQEQRAREAAQRARDQEITRANQEIALRRAANDQAQVDLVNAKNAERTLTQAYYQLVQQDLVNHLNAMRTLQQPTSSPSQYTAPSPFGFGGASTATPSIGGSSSVDNSRSNIYNIYVNKGGVITGEGRAISGTEAVRIVREILRTGEHGTL